MKYVFWTLALLFFVAACMFGTAAIVGLLAVTVVLGLPAAVFIMLMIFCAEAYTGERE